MARSYNFCSGPAALPTAVLQQARAEMLDWQGSGVSVMEMSHRSPEIIALAERAEATLRALLALSDDYAVLFLQGGASAQFAAVPLNLGAGRQARADYVDTGYWSKKALAEAGRYLDVNVAASAADDHYHSIPPQQTWQLSERAAYLHYTPNETIGGVEFFWTPAVSVPLVADMSSTLLSRPLQVADYGVIYAGAQKKYRPGRFDTGAGAPGFAGAGRGDLSGHTRLERGRRPRLDV